MFLPETKLYCVFRVFGEPTISPKEGNISLMRELERGVQRIRFLLELRIGVVNHCGKVTRHFVKKVVPNWWIYKRVLDEGREKM